MCKLFFRTILLSVIVFTTLQFIVSCAKIISPTGGPSDTVPPKLVSVKPDSSQVNFSSRTIIFEFDEFFTLKTQGNPVQLSPLTNEDIVTAVKGKKLFVTLPTNLAKNQTYKLSIHKAIADINEGNVLSNLEYLFSTNSHIDSMSFSGNAVILPTNEPCIDAILFLFPADADSCLLKKQHSYITYSQNGIFSFENLAPGEYKLFALEEKDNDFIFNNKEEALGFSDSLIIIDTLSLKNENKITNTKIYLFKEQDTLSHILKSTRLKKGMTEICFSNPVENVKINPLNLSGNYAITHRQGSDTVKFWYTTEPDVPMKLAVLLNDKPLDTITVSKKKAGRENSDTTQNKLIIKPYNLLPDSILEYKTTFMLSTSNPVKDISKRRIFLLCKSDTIYPDIRLDSIYLLQFIINHKFSENEKYMLVIPDSSVYDIFGNTNPSARFSFKVNSPSDYGNLVLLSDTINSGCIIFQFKNERNFIKYRFSYPGNLLKYEFSNILQGKYTLEMVYDNNCNTKWDSGNFRKRLQPETIIKLQSSIDLKSNWTSEIDLSNNNIEKSNNNRNKK